MSSYSVLYTASTSSTNNPNRDVIKNGVVRYRRKGYGFIVALVLTFCYFYFIPNILKSYWLRIETKYQADIFYFIGIMWVHTGASAFWNLLIYWIHISKLPFFERYRIVNKPWPWEEDPQKWRILLKKTFKTLLIVHFVLLPVTVYADILLGYKFRIDADSFPSHLEIIKQMIFLMLTEDFMFYWSHRFLHWKKIYPYIHKIHHEYTNTVSICTEYAHPLEWVFGNLLPTNLGYKLLGNNIHFATYTMWVTWRIIEAAYGHCGYEFSWIPFRLLPFKGSSAYHNYHHSHNVGNYTSFFTFWDTICGTNKAYYSYLAKREKEESFGEEERKEVDEMKVKDKLN